MLFGSPEEKIETPQAEAEDDVVGSPPNVCDLFKHMDCRDRQTPKEIGDSLTAEGFDYMQVANCLIICRPQTLDEARKWIAEHVDDAASTHIAGQKVPESWREGIEFSMGAIDQEFKVGEVVVLRRSDGSIKFGIVQELSVLDDAHFVLVVRSFCRSFVLSIVGAGNMHWCLRSPSSTTPSL